MDVWESRAVVGPCTAPCVLWDMSAQQDCTRPLPFGREDGAPQYSSFLQACGVPWCCSAFLGRDWEQSGCV